MKEDTRARRDRRGERAPRHQHTYPIAIGVIKGLELNDIGMAYNPHDLKLTVLCESCQSTRGQTRTVENSCINTRLPGQPQPYLEPFVLQDPLDGSVLAAGCHLGLEDHPE